MAKKKEGNGVGPGHNSTLTDEEKRALTADSAQIDLSERTALQRAGNA